LDVDSAIYPPQPWGRLSSDHNHYRYQLDFDASKLAEIVQRSNRVRVRCYLRGVLG